jgi:hypothetical protein
MTLSKSPDRGTFQLESYLRRKEKDGEEPNAEYLEMFKSWAKLREEQEADPEWQQNNLEYDLRNTDWVVAKAKASDSYAQNIYAALCNMRWQKVDVWQVLTDEYWSCSWRSAGGVVADILGKGDYIDWYCSGIRDDPVEDDLDAKAEPNHYVPEGTVTDEIKEDFLKLGWVASEWPKDKI